VTQDDPFFVLEFFRQFFQASIHDIAWLDLRAVVVQKALGKPPRVLARQMWNFFGPVDFFRMGFRFAVQKVGARLLEWLGVSAPVLTVERAARAAGVPVHRTANVNSPEFVAWLKHQEVDVLMSVAAAQKFSPAVLEAPRWGCLNSHSGALPKYRGMMPVFWTMLHREPRATVTIHKMNEELDDGAIVLQESVEIAPGDSLAEVIRRTKRLSARMMRETLRLIHAGQAVLVQNDRAQSTYFSFPTRQDVRSFRRQGYRLL
jgi:methionyl-tRNA formyltransferase